MLGDSVRVGINSIDRLLAMASNATLGDRSSLIVPMFHGVYPDRDSASSTAFYPQQGITLSDLRTLLASFTRAGFTFIRPEDLHWKLAPWGRYVLLTFDDGYANNLSVLPLLQEFNAPATFFISANHVREGKAFWWDVLYRETIGANRPAQKFTSASARCKTMRNHEIEAYLKAEFHLEKLSPAGELDRPMTPTELKTLATNPFAVIGNHTLDHAILTNYSPAEVKEQCAGCQQALFEMTGSTPSCIAYPNGNLSPGIVEAALQSGLTSGVSTAQGKNKLPLPASTAAIMALERVVPRGNGDIESQCSVFRSSLSVYNSLAQLLAKSRGVGW